MVYKKRTRRRSPWKFIGNEVESGTKWKVYDLSKPRKNGVITKYVNKDKDSKGRKNTITEYFSAGGSHSRYRNGKKVA